MDIHFENVSFWYSSGGRRPERTTVRVDDLHIPFGQFIAVAGASGSGKSTLAQLLAGLLLPREGKIRVGTYLTSKPKDNRALRKKIGIVFQFPEHQLFKETVYADIQYGLADRNLSEGELADKVKQTMSWAGLPYERYKERSPFRLSGGEKRKAALAGALVMKPDILILDEPTAGLDSAGRKALLSILGSMSRTQPATILLITHELQDALEYADRILVMQHGEIAADMTPSQIRGHMDTLKKARLLPTAPLRFIEAFESVFPEGMPDSLIREDEVIGFVAGKLASSARGCHP